MIYRAQSEARRSRWAISFADLLLLLLGFFVMLQASGQKRDAMLAEVRQQFGGRAVRSGVELRAGDLFLPGEAMLSESGRARIARAIAGLRGQGGKLEISSRGMDRARERFDEWDLAAARLGAVARYVRTQGFGGEGLVIRGLDQVDDPASAGQMILIGPASSKPR